MIYFAYGSNLNPTQMAERCPGHRSLGVARLPDHRLCFPRYSRTWRCASAGFEASPGDVVWGALYEVPGRRPDRSCTITRATTRTARRNSTATISAR